MKRTINLSNMLMPVLFLMLCFGGAACDKPKNEVPGPKPEAQQQAPAGAPQGTPAPAPAGGAPIEAKQNLQQGLSYVSIAKGNPGAAAENYENALQEFSRAIEKYPDYVEAYGNRAVIYMQQKKFNKAMDDLKKAESINPDDKNIQYNLIAWYSLQNQVDRALDSLDKTLSLGFSNYDALRADPDLRNVRNSPEFKKVCEKHKVFLK